MVTEMITDQMQKLRRTLFSVPNLKYRFVKVTQVCVQRFLNKFDDLTKFDISSIKTAHMIQRIYKFD